MRWATVGSETRNARAISSVVKPPSSRSVSATRASADSTGMACGEDQPQQVIADVIVECGVEVRGRGVLRDLQLVAELLMLALEQRASAQQVDGAVLRRRHEPRAGIARNARFGPLLERGNQRVVREVFGQPDIADDARQPGDEAGRFDSPDCVDCASACRSRVTSLRS